MMFSTPESEFENSIKKNYTLSIVLEDEPGSLTRVTGLFSARGYNIHSLSVSKIEKNLSRIILVTHESEKTVLKIILQIKKILSVHSVQNLTLESKKTTRGVLLKRALALVKIEFLLEKKKRLLQVVSECDAQILMLNNYSLILEITGTEEHIEKTFNVLKPFGIVEVCKSGLAAILPM